MPPPLSFPSIAQFVCLPCLFICASTSQPLPAPVLSDSYFVCWYLLTSSTSNKQVCLSSCALSHDFLLPLYAFNTCSVLMYSCCPMSERCSHWSAVLSTLRSLSPCAVCATVSAVTKSPVVLVEKCLYEITQLYVLLPKGIVAHTFSNQLPSATSCNEDEK